MIPISRDVRLKKKLDGVTYSFLPPVGDIEIELLNSTPQIMDDSELKIAYDKVSAEMEKEYKGKRKPVKKKWEEMISERIKNNVPKENIDRTIKIMRDTINMVLVSWDAKAKFPKGEPSTCLTMDMVRELYEWYWEQYPLKLDELKNL